MDEANQSAMEIPTPKRVGKGVHAASKNAKDPQWWLAGSVHPYAPFVGNALKWESNVYDDGTTYEGLMMLDVPHNKGTIIFGKGLGGGIQRADKGDKYEGEFDTGFAHGMGQFSNTKKNKIFRGEYKAGQRHGCGAEYDMSPYVKRLNAGQDPDAAWEEALPEIEKKVKYGTWLKDTFLTGPDDSGRWCHIHEIKGTLQEVGEVLAKVRMFQNKPDGEVMMRFAQDANGVPAPVMQDPLHYPHGTAFLAPGPMGQCHPVPSDPKLKTSMVQAANIHQRIYESYNIPYEITPGSVLEKAQKLWKRKEARKKRAEEKRKRREEQRIRRMELAAGGGKAAASKEEAETVEEKPAEPEEYDDDDLIAALPAEEGDERGNGSGSGMPPSVIANISLGLNRGMVALQRAFHHAAITAPPRRQLTRPKRSS